ncbi:alpha/beta hydrolase fold (plasmid) [Rhizorhabdus wittichii RW1]|uniref:Alpha/beta hydrolase fold n=1 Tax=Rhizorhabdus wittichii (strain DSM 6014 / CCUG 31198 / JCM 15750 / NBRC 105917 / EY 4224 / RW1) TaxID=392499 RepID=A0A9J9HH13_RHIWR|nr:alpha/beta hydrolase fold [Rhizorhabdus wittichii RW1]
MVKKPTLILLPGSLCDATMWRAQVDALEDICVPLVVDLGGFDTIAAMADHVLEYAPDHSFALAGFSLGGFAALEVVRRAPDRVARLTLLGTSARPDKPENAPRRLANIAAFEEDADPPLRAFADLTRGSTTPEGVSAAVIASMRHHGPASYGPHQRAMMTRPDARPHLSDIACPTLVLCGGEDRATPPEGNREIAETIPGATYVELAEVGHMVTLEAPDAVSAAMRNWLLFPEASTIHGGPGSHE